MKDYSYIHLLNRDGLGYDYDIDRTQYKLTIVLRKGNNKIFVAEHEGRVIGYVHAAEYECLYLESLKDILALAVDPDMRGRGVGRALLAAVEAWAKETGSVGVRLVSGINRVDAHRFYLACGYIDRKDQKNFIKLFGDSHEKA